jgi:hypothetical protein
MASVVDWLPQLTGALRARAGCPGSNGSTMAANGGADVAALADGVLDGVMVAEPALLFDDEDEEELLPQPATKPITTANATACTYRFRPRPIPGAPLLIPARAGDHRSGALRVQADDSNDSTTRAGHTLMSRPGPTVSLPCGTR